MKDISGKRFVGELNCDDPDMRTIEGKAIFQLIMETGKCPCCNEIVCSTRD